jgi:hypothetical protein
MKTCAQCGDTKPFEAFYRNKTKQGGRESSCKACCSLRDAARYAAEPEPVRERSLARYCANKDVIQSQQKERYRKRREAYTAVNRAYTVAHPELCREIRARWAKANRPIVNAKTARRRAARLSATPVWVDPAQLLPAYVLASSISELTGEAHEVDHIVPLQGESVCGLHVPWNLRVIPAAENASKGSKLIEELVHA